MEININDPAFLFLMILVIRTSRAECKTAVASKTPALPVSTVRVTNFKLAAPLLAPFGAYLFIFLPLVW